MVLSTSFTCLIREQCISIGELHTLNSKKSLSNRSTTGNARDFNGRETCKVSNNR